MGYLTDGVLKYHFYTTTELACCGYANVKIKPSSVSIPEEVGGHKVTMIAGNAFANEHTLVEIEFTQNIEQISANAFYNCTHLERVIINKTNISRLPLTFHKFAFYHCPQLLIISSTKRKIHLDTLSIVSCDKMEVLNAYICKANTSAISKCKNLKFLLIGNSAILEDDCFANSDINALCFEGNISHPDKMENWLNKDVKLYCLPNSNLLDLSYSGYCIETT